jgi:hypothetical protein
VDAIPFLCVALLIVLGYIDYEDTYGKGRGNKSTQKGERHD